MNNSKHKRAAEKLAGGQCEKLTFGAVIKNGDIFSNDMYCHHAGCVGRELNQINQHFYYRPLIRKNQQPTNGPTKTPKTDAVWTEFMQSHFNAEDICKLRILAEMLETENRELREKLKAQGRPTITDQ